MTENPDPSAYERFVESRLRESLADSPVVMLEGPRQSGKTTLARRFIAEGFVFRSLDDATTLAAAASDPVGFVNSTAGPLIVDEIQRAPGLLLAIKAAVDADRRPGRFLLTGSANLLRRKQTPDSLAGRIDRVTLLPLGRGELLGRRFSFIDAVFSGDAPTPGVSPLRGDALVSAVLAGGFAPALARPTEARRVRWARQYVESLIDRDLPELARLDLARHLPRLVSMLAHHSAALPNFSEHGRALGIDHKTVQQYTRLLQDVYLLRLVEPWHAHPLTRLVKTRQKLFFVDSGVLAAWLGLTQAALARDRQRFGALLETYVHGELSRQATWSETAVRIDHLRDRDDHEVDLVLENSQGRVFGVEVKASATIGRADFRGLSLLAGVDPQRFVGGVVLYDGDQVLPFGDRLWAAPISALWG